MVRAKSTRPAPVKKKGSRETCPPDHTAEGEKRNRKERCRHGFGMSLRGLLLFIPCRFLLFLYPSLLLPLEALLWL